VGGLPLAGLNQLELQFLLLNDFRLVISSAEMQRYAKQLVLFSSADPQTQQNPHPHTHPLPPTHTCQIRRGGTGVHASTTAARKDEQ
ncbi:hypothetical protein H0H87_001551, partial [Tephrocybe sp. NHM501043]